VCRRKLPRCRLAGAGPSFGRAAGTAVDQDAVYLTDDLFEIARSAIGQIHERETARAPSIPTGHDTHIGNGNVECLERIPNLVDGGSVGKISKKNLTSGWFHDRESPSCLEW
jgi:hypothetical protein